MNIVRKVLVLAAILSAPHGMASVCPPEDGTSIWDVVGETTFFARSPRSTRLNGKNGPWDVSLVARVDTPDQIVDAIQSGKGGSNELRILSKKQLERGRVPVCAYEIGGRGSSREPTKVRASVFLSKVRPTRKTHPIIKEINAPEIVEKVAPLVIDEPVVPQTEPTIIDQPVEIEEIDDKTVMESQPISEPALTEDVLVDQNPFIPEKGEAEEIEDIKEDPPIPQMVSEIPEVPSSIISNQEEDVWKPTLIDLPSSWSDYPGLYEKLDEKQRKNFLDIKNGVESIIGLIQDRNNAYNLTEEQRDTILKFAEKAWRAKREWDQNLMQGFAFALPRFGEIRNTLYRLAKDLGLIGLTQ